MAEWYGKKHVVNVGRRRLMFRFGWPYRVGITRREGGTVYGGFKFGVFNYHRRNA